MEPTRQLAFLSPLLPALVLLASAGAGAEPRSAPVVDQGNGGAERGGGDEYGLRFVAVGRQAVALLRDWRRRDPEAVRAIDVELLQRKLDTVDVLSRPRLFLNGQEVSAINERKDNRLLISRARMDQFWGQGEALRYSFFLHEFLGLLGVPDRHYEVSGVFLARLENETELGGIRKEAAARLNNIVGLLRSAYDRQLLDIPLSISTIELSGEFRRCDEKPGPSCKNVAAMLQNVVRSGLLSLPFKHGSDQDPDEQMRRYMAFASRQTETRGLWLQATGTRFNNGLADAGDAIQRKARERIRHVNACANRTEGALRCAMKEIRTAFEVLKKETLLQRRAIALTQAAALLEIETYTESDDAIVR